MAANAGEMQDSDQAQAPQLLPPVGGGGDGSEGDSDNAGGVQIIGDRTFVNQSGVWIDTRFDPSAMTTVKVQFLSEDYFKLLELRPDLAEAFALGERVIAISNGVAFEVTAEAQPPIDFSTLG